MIETNAVCVNRAADLFNNSHEASKNKTVETVRFMASNGLRPGTEHHIKSEESDDELGAIESS